MSAIARMLDANLNRAGEAIRVMEDAARFALDDAALCLELKSMRHELRAVSDELPMPTGWLVAHRNTPGDVGTSIKTMPEMNRSGMLDIVTAAGKRLTEALRAIEEACKTLNADAAVRIESLRYRAYTVDARLQHRFGSGAARQWPLCVIVTESLCKRPWKHVVQAAVESGADCIQIREKQLEDSELVRRAREAIAIAHASGVSVIVNDRADIALAAGADGVHVGQADLPVHEVRRIAGRQLLVGVSTHDLQEAKAAVEAGADYCGVGAMFASSVKPLQTSSSPSYLRDFLARFPHTPHLAIGGITLENVQRLTAVGVRGIAVCSAVCAAEDPGAVVAEFIRLMTLPSSPRTCTPEQSLEALDAPA